MPAEYDLQFLNQYVKIPAQISEKIDALHPDRYKSVRHCVGLLIVNLLKFREVAYSRDKNFYTKQRTKNYTFTNMKHAVDIAVADGYAVMGQIGYRTVGFERGFSSRLLAGSRLTEFQQINEMELDVESLPILSIDKRPVFGPEDFKVVREHSADSKELADRLDVIYEEALKLNRDYWNKMIIDTSAVVLKQPCFNRVGLTRIFKEDEVGRYFQKGELSFQQLAEEDRKKLLINGEKVTEIDYSAMHPHILYAWEHKQCPDDVYERIMAQCGCSRFVAKNIFLIAINCRGEKSLNGAVNSNKGKTERANRRRAVPEKVLYNELKNQNLRALDVVEAIKKSHPAIAEYVYGASANKLMLVESNIMTSVLLKLMYLNVPTLPVHDSVIVPSRNDDTARRIMQDTYREHTGFGIVIK